MSLPARQRDVRRLPRKVRAALDALGDRITTDERRSLDAAICDALTGARARGQVDSITRGLRFYARFVGRRAVGLPVPHEP